MLANTLDYSQATQCTANNNVLAILCGNINRTQRGDLACFIDWVSDVTTPIHCSSVPRPLSPCVEPGQVPTPEGLSSLASTGGAAQTKSQAGVTGNACCLVGEGGEGNLTSHNLVQRGI